MSVKIEVGPFEFLVRKVIYILQGMSQKSVRTLLEMKKNIIAMSLRINIASSAMNYKNVL